MQTSQKTKYMRKTAKHPARRQKPKHAIAIWNNNETGQGEIPKHTGPKSIDVKPTPQKLLLTTWLWKLPQVQPQERERLKALQPVQELLDSELLVQQHGAEANSDSSWSAIANEAGGGCSARRNLNVPFTELHRTGQEAAKTELFEARTARHYARQHAGPAGRNLTDVSG